MQIHSIVCQLTHKSREERQQIIQDFLDEQKIPYTLQKVPHEELDAYNIVIHLNGSSPDCLVVGAHYDPFPNAGAANDNGSGVSILLALIKHFWHQELKYSIDFVFFVWEEVGHLGSKLFVETANKKNLLGMINLDMCGTGDTIVFDHKNNIEDLLSRIFSQTCRELSLPYYILPRLPPGDDLQFEKAGVPSISIAAIPSKLVGFVSRLARVIHPSTSIFKRLLLFPLVILALIRPPSLIAVMHKPSDTADLVCEESLKKVFLAVKHAIRVLALEV